MHSDYLKLEIRPSQIPNAGNGVFVTQPIVQNEIITEYRGNIVEYKQNEQMPSDRCHFISPTLMIDSDNVGGMVNDLVDLRQLTVEEMRNIVDGGNFPKHPNLDYNCAYARVQQKVLIMALRDINVGEELYVNYGRSYWLGAYNKFIENEKKMVMNLPAERVPLRG